MLPKENEIVICKITSIQPHAAFCALEEYPDLTGIISISEIAAGRIRSIKEYIKEGERVVCLVLKNKPQIILSYRRVTPQQRKEKLAKISRQEAALKIISEAADALKINEEELKSKLKKLFELWAEPYFAFEAVAYGKVKLSDFIEEKIVAALEAAIKKRIKPKLKKIEGELKLICYQSGGVELIKSALKMIEEKGFKVAYKGGGTWRVFVETVAPKEAEKNLSAAIKEALEFASKNNITVNWSKK